jgi:hypothetical protein
VKVGRPVPYDADEHAVISESRDALPFTFHFSPFTAVASAALPRAFSDVHAQSPRLPET